VAGPELPHARHAPKCAPLGYLAEREGRSGKSRGCLEIFAHDGHTGSDETTIKLGELGRTLRRVATLSPTSDTRSFARLVCPRRADAPRRVSYRGGHRGKVSGDLARGQDPVDRHRRPKALLLRLPEDDSHRKTSGSTTTHIDMVGAYPGSQVESGSATATAASWHQIPKRADGTPVPGRFSVSRGLQIAICRKFKHVTSRCNHRTVIAPGAKGRVERSRIRTPPGGSPGRSEVRTSLAQVGKLQGRGRGPSATGFKSRTGKRPRDMAWLAASWFDWQAQARGASDPGRGQS